MKTISMNKTWVCLLLLLFISLNSFTQECWDFGGKYKAYVKEASSPLIINMKNNVSLQSLSFVSSVGGVAFLSVAEPEISLKNASIALNYIPGNRDSHRLQIIMNKDTLYPNLPDWQLIPIAKYSNSNYNSCVSLFGPKCNIASYDIVYHPAFQNTLLGMRLLQADMALMDLTTHWQLPKYNSKIITGIGENSQENVNWKDAAFKIQDILNLADFQSWVLTDDNVHIIFKAKEKKLVFEGSPYYYFWKQDTASLKAYDKLLTQYNILINEYNTNVEFYNSTQKINFKNKAEELMRKINKIEFLIKESDPSVIPVTEITNKLKTNYPLLLQLNPPVFNAVKNVSQYSAFFRYVKLKSPETWNKFFSKIKMVNVSPVIKTPTQLPKK